MPILSMRLSGARRGGSSATQMGHRACSPRVPLATTPDGDQLASRGWAAGTDVAPPTSGARLASAATDRFIPARLASLTFLLHPGGHTPQAERQDL